MTENMSAAQLQEQLQLHLGQQQLKQLEQLKEVTSLPATPGLATTGQKLPTQFVINTPRPSTAKSSGLL